MWQNFNTKQGTQKKTTGRYGNPRHTFFTNGIYFVQKNQVPFEYCLHFTKSHMFMIIDQKINHLHNDRVANM